MGNVTAKVALNHVSEPAEGQVTLSFNADYGDGANSEWAKYTPALSLNMVVKEEVAEKHFPLGKKFTLTFSDEELETENG